MLAYKNHLQFSKNFLTTKQYWFQASFFNGLRFSSKSFSFISFRISGQINIPAFSFASDFAENFSVQLPETTTILIYCLDEIFEQTQFDMH